MHIIPSTSMDWDSSRTTGVATMKATIHEMLLRMDQRIKELKRLNREIKAEMKRRGIK
jgi:hypothetical protein